MVVFTPYKKAEVRSNQDRMNTFLHWKIVQNAGTAMIMQPAI